MFVEKMKQIVRHVTQGAFAGNFAPLHSHPGLAEIVPTIRMVYQSATDHEVTFPLQFGEGE